MAAFFATTFAFTISALSAPLTTHVNDPSCPVNFRLIASENEKLGKRKSALPDASRIDVERRQDELDQLVRGDLLEANRKSGELVRVLQNEMKAQGFETQIEKRAAARHYDKATKSFMILPEREVLTVKAGTSNSVLARELRAYEKYVAERLSDPKLPQLIRETPFNMSLDPLFHSLTNTRGVSRRVGSSHGAGISFSAHELVASTDDVIEIIRHERRHMKIYFDVLSGRETPYRAALVDTKNADLVTFADREGVESLTLQPVPGKNAPKVTAYATYFSTEELNAFMANVRASQSRLGRVTEDMSKSIKDGTANDTQQYRAYKASIKAIGDEGLMQARKIERLSESTLENIETTRKIIRQSSNEKKFAARLSERVSVAFPGVREVAINLAQDAAQDGRTLMLLVPEDIAKRGADSIQAYAESYLKQLEAETLRTQRELRTRIDDLKRDPISRLAPPSPTTPQTP